MVVACNMYVSAACRQKEALLKLCDEAIKTSTLVHAFADNTYERSSFHLVGKGADFVKEVSSLACSALLRLKLEEVGTHPTVGVVDHISILPVDVDFDRGEIARSIGRQIQTTVPSLNILYYGSAHPEGLSLAKIRREQTNFFQDRSTTNALLLGAPPHFVENYNLRLSASKQVARTLTQRVRGDFVEALTLPHRDGSWEVACNLLKLNLQEHVKKIALEWQEEHGISVRGYPVGTSLAECQAVWEMAEEKRAEHSEAVRTRFELYLDGKERIDEA